MEDPPTFTQPPTRTTSATGKREMAGAEALSWSIETLDIGGEIRSRLIRLQAWVRDAFLGDESKSDSK